MVVVSEMFQSRNSKHPRIPTVMSEKYQSVWLVPALFYAMLHINEERYVPAGAPSEKYKLALELQIIVGQYQTRSQRRTSSVQTLQIWSVQPLRSMQTGMSSWRARMGHTTFGSCKGYISLYIYVTIAAGLQCGHYF